MNILMALSQVEVTGAEVYAATLSDALIEKGHSVFIVSDTFTKPTKAEFHPLAFNNRRFFDRIRNVAFLVKFISKNRIDIVHAHSRASSWVSYFAAKITGIPLITTIHGRQPAHLSRRMLLAFGSKIIAICEQIKEHLIRDLGVPQEKIILIRNGINVPTDEMPTANENHKTVSIIGRLSGAKGEVAAHLLGILEKIYGVKILVIGGKEIPEKFERFRQKADFLGFVGNPMQWILKSDLIIGSGRVAMESLIHGKPTFAIGEACNHGLISEENFRAAMASNFGDISEINRQNFDWEKIENELKNAVENPLCSSEIQEKVRQEYDSGKITREIENAYQTTLVEFHQQEIPILLYHRVVKSAEEAGQHGIYVTAEQFETHLKILRRKGFETITFADLERINRFDSQKKYVILTFDDGYEDNFTVAFPLLKKYGAKAVIYLLTDRTKNTCDASDCEPLVPLLVLSQILEMQNYGIEFGSHGKTHSDLTKISREEANQEIVESKKILERQTGSEILSFCYPYGRSDEEIERMPHEAGYKFGIATDTGTLGLHENLMHIRRIGIFPNTNSFNFARKVSGNYTFKRERRAKKKLKY